MTNECPNTAVSGVFPIESETACLLKWGWSSIFLYKGETNSCHRTVPSLIEPGALREFHNTPAKRREREVMLEGQWPGRGCEYCRDIEAAGGVSDRLHNLRVLESNPDQRRLIPLELYSNRRATSVVPTMVEVFFTNRCNMGCAYCGPNFSTQWVSENRIHGQMPHHAGHISHEDAELLDSSYPGKLEQFWNWLSNNYSQLRMFHVLGGEPFYQNETEQVIEFFDHHPNPDLDLRIFSNLKVNCTKFRHILSLLQDLLDQRKCRSVGIIASIDCWGIEQEYVRHGMNLGEWSRNYELMLFEYPLISVSINSTVNALSIKTMPELLWRIRNWDAQRQARSTARCAPTACSFTMLVGPEFMHLGIFPRSFFDDEFQQIILALPKDTGWQRANVDYMHGLWKIANATEHSPAKICALKSFLDGLDQRRGTQWRSVFPWLNSVE